MWSRDLYRHRAADLACETDRPMRSRLACVFWQNLGIGRALYWLKSPVAVLGTIPPKQPCGS